MSVTRRRFFPLVALAAALLLVTGLMIGFGNSTKAQEDAGHPAHIHSGTCATLGDVVHPLDNVGGGTMMGTPVTGSPAGATSAIPVDSSVTIVQAALADLVGGEFAINVHESPENISNYIACGDVGGEVYGSDLAFGLAELNDSGYFGVAHLHDNGDGTTTVGVFLMEETGAAPAAPSPSPVMGAPSGEETAVSIVNFAYDPNPLDITVGTTVTWTNEDSAPHTATQDGGSGFNSGRLDQGQSFSFTFEEAGTFNYFCEFHANMTATINVT